MFEQPKIIEAIFEPPVDFLEKKQFEIQKKNQVTLKKCLFMDKINSCLFEILNPIQEIQVFFKNKPKNFIDYHNYIKTKQTVERNIEIIDDVIKGDFYCKVSKKEIRNYVE